MDVSSSIIKIIFDIACTSKGSVTYKGGVSVEKGAFFEKFPVHIIPELHCQKKCANLNFVYPHSTRLYDRLFLFEKVKNAPHPISR